MADRRSDGELVVAALNGSHEAFGELIGRYRDAVFGVAFHHLGDFEEARDATQETFVKVYLSLSRLRNPESFGSWVCRIADGTARDAARRWKREVPLAAAESVPSRLVSPQAAAERADLSRQVRDALQVLSEPARLALILHCVNGYSHAEVATLIGATPGAVKSRISRAKSRMRKGMMEMVAGTLKQGSGRFAYEARDDGGRVITGIAEAASAADVRRRLTQKGYRVARVSPDRRTPEEVQAEAQHAIKGLAQTVLQQALKDKAEGIRIAVCTSGGRQHVAVTYGIAGKWHEVMSLPVYVWAPLRARLAEMAELRLTGDVRRQTGTIRFRSGNKEREIQTAFAARRIGLSPRASQQGGLATSQSSIG